jgi:hypothetical protein
MEYNNSLFSADFNNKVMADVTIEDAAKEEWDLVALPGGMPGTYELECSLWEGSLGLASDSSASRC